MALKTIRRALSLPFYDKLSRARRIFFWLKSALFYRWVFRSFGKNSLIYPPTMINNPRFIHIGAGVTIQRGVRLEAVLVDPENPPEIRIGNNVNIEQDVHISAVGKIYIQDNVGIGARSTLLCSSHPFLDVHDPVKISGRIGGKNSVIEIGEGSLLGIGSVIQMNVRLGKYVVVGSNSVVKNDVPGYCVVDGHPAAVVLVYDAGENRWSRPSKKS